MKIKKNDILLIGALGAAAYFVYRKTAGASLVNNGCIPGARYYNSRYDLYTDYCPKEYPTSAWYLLSDGKLYPEPIIPSLGYIKIGSTTWVHENQYQDLLTEWEIIRQQGISQSFEQFAIAFADGATVLTELEGAGTSTAGFEP